MLIACLLAAACAQSESPDEASTADSSSVCDETAVSEAVEQLGRRLKDVSLSAPDSIAIRQIREAYAPLVTTELLDAWMLQPGDAPGRLTSSPWPDRIEVRSMEPIDDSVCRVDGDVVYLTSVEVAGGGVASHEPVLLRVQKVDAGWRVSSYESGALSESNSGAAQNDQAAASDVDSAGESVETDRPPSAASSAADREPSEVIRQYYEAVEAGDFVRAYALWGADGAASGQTLDQFATGFAETAQVDVEIGTPGRIEPAAGSRYVEVPVVIRAVTTDGEEQRFEGTYTLRRSVVDGASAEQRRWHIYSADVDRTP